MNKCLRLQVVVVMAFLIGGDSNADSPRGDQAAISIPSLSQRDYTSSLSLIEELGQFDGYRSYAVGYDSDGLALRAVMNVPVSEMPANGFPVIIINHGNALAAGIDRFREYYSDDQESRGYQDLIQSNPLTRFAREGFVVFQPDYRGHGYSENRGKRGGFWQLDRNGKQALNRHGDPVPRTLDDDGLRFNGFLYSAYYTIDVLNLLAALSDFEDPPKDLYLDLANLFAWGRSLGGDVTARVIACTNKVRAASLWVPATTSLWDQAHHYHYDSPHYADGLAMETLLVELQTYNRVYGSRLVTRDLLPNNFLDQVKTPVLVQVSMDDTGVRSAWGIEYHYELQEYGVETGLVIYPGEDHVFQGEVYEQAIRADLQFFRSHMK
ncbi:MAG: prolyl oligopeptidase family serine peptidase [Xanthomonadales bacterium]|jgi:dipeptidyl aminopeptidase/acylaminoacyl peptidase|nr:prolyl oligopeptidase family serine peptidase [Xanthomonadales bacterium]